MTHASTTYRPGDRVTVSGRGITLGWKRLHGVVTKVTRLRVYVRWEHLDHSREHKYWELKPLSLD